VKEAYEDYCEGGEECHRGGDDIGGGTGGVDTRGEADQQEVVLKTFKLCSEIQFNVNREAEILEAWESRLLYPLLRRKAFSKTTEAYALSRDLISETPK